MQSSMKWVELTDEQIVERYYELRRLQRHVEYVLDEEEMEEYNGICDYMLDKILKEIDVLQRLKHR